MIPPPNTVIHSDVCIVGTGPGGAIPAVKLAEAGYEVLVCEVGPPSSGAGVRDFLGKVDLCGKADLPPLGVVQLGGFSNLWAGRLARLEAVDFRPRPKLGLPGWPIDYEDVPYEAAFELLSGGLPYPQQKPAPPPFSTMTQPLTEKLSVKQFVWAKKPFNAGAYLTAAQKRLSNLRMLLDCQAESLGEAENGRSVTHAHFRTKSGNSFRVAAKLFIIAAGGIETPRLLLSSRTRMPHGIGNAHDLVGRYLSTHPKLNLAKLRLATPMRMDHPLFANQFHGSLRERYGIGLPEALLEKKGLLNHYLQLVPSYEYASSEAFQRVRQLDSVTAATSGFAVQKAGEWLPSVGRFVFNFAEWTSRLQGQSASYKLRIFLDQFPSADNRVTLSGRRNAKGVETADVRWNMSDSDIASIIDFTAAVNAELERASAGSINMKEISAEAIRRRLTGLHSHYMGTTRMGSTARDGVVDKNCRVFGLENLYVSGPSVFPTYGHANPFWTITALGLRLAAHIQKAHPRSGHVQASAAGLAQSDFTLNVSH